MHELLRPLPPGSLGLDLGCAGGSVDSGDDQFTVVRFDLERESPAPSNFVQGDAAKLRFSSACFDVGISNHNLEHVENLASSLVETGRVLKLTGAVYVAVPDATTVTDKLDRWLARGGGYVNQFRSAQDLALEIERATGLPHNATRTLCTSLSFTGCFRLLDGLLETRLSVYGSAFYFGAVEPRDVDCETWSNVCVRCGSGSPSSWLENMGRVTRSWFGLSIYACPQCETRNLFYC